MTQIPGLTPEALLDIPEVDVLYRYTALLEVMLKELWEISKDPMQQALCEAIEQGIIRPDFWAFKLDQDKLNDPDMHKRYVDDVIKIKMGLLKKNASVAEDELAVAAPPQNWGAAAAHVAWGNVAAQAGNVVIVGPEQVGQVVNLQAPAQPMFIWNNDDTQEEWTQEVADAAWMELDGWDNFVAGLDENAPVDMANAVPGMIWDPHLGWIPDEGDMEDYEDEIPAAGWGMEEF